MEIPKDIKLHEHAIATFWFDDQGILHSVSKPGPRSVVIMTDYISFVNKITNGQRVCHLIDVSRADPMDKKTRDFASKNFWRIHKAMALLSDTPLGTMIGKIFMLKAQPFPTEQFKHEDEARKWLKQHL